MKTLISVSVLALVFSGTRAQEKKPEVKKPQVKKAEVGKNVFLEVEGDKRRVIVNAYVCLRQGVLEQLLTRKLMKEHEAILAADVDARIIHAALQAAGAEPGKPVQYRPKFMPPSGTVIKVSLEYKNKEGKVVRVPAQQWIRNIKTKKDLEHDWVFAGSALFEDPDKKSPPYYLANDGDVICVSNFDTAMLDLPIDSSKDNDALNFEAQTDRIPPLHTRVQIILEPVVAKKKK
jgi:hypothetical protein